jgi:hypothetical protein
MMVFKDEMEAFIVWFAKTEGEGTNSDHNTGLFKMIVGVLTTLHTQYT